MHHGTLNLPLVLAWTLAGCGGALSSGDKSAEAPGDYATTATSPGAADTGIAGTAPPEQEENLLLRPPAQTDVYVFVANPDRNTVTRIHVETLAVDTAPVGANPQIVLTTADYATAVVFNQGDDSVTLLDADTLDRQTVDVRDNFNDMVLSPDGQYAVLWHNAAREDDDDDEPEGLQSFNEVSFVDTETGDHYPMAVGFNPRMVRFTPDGTLAVVVADAYLAVVDLTVTPLLPNLIELVEDELNPPVAEEVILAADGSFAWVRQFGATELLVVDLVTEAVDSRPAGVNPTDLDLSHDGTEAIAVARGSQELWIYAADDPDASPRVVPLPPGSPYGSLLVDPSGDQGILYTTSTLTEQYAVWDRNTDVIEDRGLVKPVQSMAINPTGETLLVFHTEADGYDTEEVFKGAWALTMVDLADLRDNPLKLPAEPIAFANGTSGTWGFFIMDDEPWLEVLDYVRLLHDEYALRSVPTYLGVLPDLDVDDGDAPAAWVSQEHELGRISFYDPDDNSLETLTGFELNSEIE